MSLTRYCFSIPQEQGAGFEPARTRAVYDLVGNAYSRPPRCWPRSIATDGGILAKYNTVSTLAECFPTELFFAANRLPNEAD